MLVVISKPIFSMNGKLHHSAGSLQKVPTRVYQVLLCLYIISKSIVLYLFVRRFNVMISILRVNSSYISTIQVEIASYSHSTNTTYAHQNRKTEKLCCHCIVIISIVTYYSTDKVLRLDNRLIHLRLASFKILYLEIKWIHEKSLLF